LPAAQRSCGADSAKIAAKAPPAGKNHAFCQPHELAEGPDSAKIACGNFRQ